MIVGAGVGDGVEVVVGAEVGAGVVRGAPVVTRVEAVCRLLNDTEPLSNLVSVQAVLT